MTGEPISAKAAKEGVRRRGATGNLLADRRQYTVASSYVQLANRDGGTCPLIAYSCSAASVDLGARPPSGQLSLLPLRSQFRQHGQLSYTSNSN